MGKEESLKREHAEYTLWQEDGIFLNHTYKNEQALLEVVKNGDVELVKKNCAKEFFPPYPQVVNYSTRKNEEYMAVITVALLARAVVEVGVTSLESFRLSDVYLKKLSSLTEIDDIIEVRNSAAVAFTELVRKRKNYRKASLYIEECKKYIAANIFKKISVKDIADALNLSPIYLERIFRNDENMTIGQYIQKEKIERARNLLIYSDRSIMEISNYLGFCSQSYFGKIFLREVGMTPKQYQQAYHMSEF